MEFCYSTIYKSRKIFDIRNVKFTVTEFLISKLSFGGWGGVSPVPVSPFHQISLHHLPRRSPVSCEYSIFTLQFIITIVMNILS
ncbi:hypothetical protein FKM82_013700 [Ascaphus truei]